MELSAHKLPGGIIGMYIHQHWPYKHPHAARTWTLENYRGYCGDLKELGFNTIMIWPVLETIPDPPTPSDEANLKKIEAVIRMLQRDLGMRAYIVLCPNVAAKNPEASRASFETRHFFWCDTRVNPADGLAVGKMMAHRERLLSSLAAMDGLVIIDSDPGGYPGSNNREFVDLLIERRELMNRLRPGIELDYWIHVGWPGYSRWYQTGKFRWNMEEEYVEALR
jgi:hypothetical protein